MTNDNLIEKRRVRFASIEGLAREDIALAGEIWLEDLFSAVWASREAMKLGVHLVRYMMDPDPTLLTYKAIDSHCHMIRDDVARTLALMRAFAVIDAFSMEEDGIRVAINLSLMQRLHVLEVKERMRMLEAADIAANAGPAATPAKEARWAPHPAIEPTDAPDGTDTPLNPLVELIGEHIRAAAENLVKARGHKAA
jgi:hypothetical protein